MVDLSVDIPSPLSECIIYCEVDCVRECCGIDAVSTDPALVQQWCRRVGPAAVAEARLQLAELIEVTENRSHRVRSSFLNHYTHSDASRGQLLDFLAAFDAGLSAGAGS
jgi:hypothetical protein